MPPVYHKVIYGGRLWFGAGEFFAPNPMAGAIAFTWYLPESATNATVSPIADAAGRVAHLCASPSQAGMNHVASDSHRESALASNPTPFTTACEGNVLGGGPLVAPGKYTASLLREGGPPLQTAITVLPDPHFAITAAERTRRNTAVMTAYGLQRQMTAARDVAQNAVTASGALRQSNPAAAQGLSLAANAVERQIATVLNSAARVQNEMDGFAGPPTAAQLRELDWAWEDGEAAIVALNKLVAKDVPAAYAAAGLTAPADLKGVPPLSRKK